MADTFVHCLGCQRTYQKPITIDAGSAEVEWQPEACPGLKEDVQIQALQAENMRLREELLALKNVPDLSGKADKSK